MLNFKRYGKGVRIWPMAKIVQSEAVWLGDHVMIDDFAFIMGGKGVTLGNYSHVCSYASILGGGEAVIGDYSVLGVGGRLFTGTENYDTMTSACIPYPYRMPYRGIVHIGKHVTMGAGCVILPGAVISEGAVIGALSLVKGLLEPWTIYAGIPCRPIKERNREAVMEQVRAFEESLSE